MANITVSELVCTPPSQNEAQTRPLPYVFYTFGVQADFVSSLVLRESRQT